MLKIRDIVVRPLEFPQAVNFLVHCDQDKYADAMQSVAEGGERYGFIGIGSSARFIGLATVYPIHPFKRVGLVVEHMIWGPDATPREKLEGAAAMYRDVPRLMGFSRKEDEKFFRAIQRAKIIKRAGKSSIVFGDQIATVWENYKR